MFVLLSLQDIVELILGLCDYVDYFLVPSGVSLQQNPGGLLYINVMSIGYLHRMVRKGGSRVVTRECVIYMRDIHIPDKYVLELVNQHNYVIQKNFL